MFQFDCDSIVWDLESTDKYEAIRELISGASALTGHDSLDLAELTRAVIERERLQSTGFGHGVAVAHGRSLQVHAPVVALGLSRKGLDFDAIDGRPVHLLFVVANHPDQEMDYLSVLSMVARVVRNELFRRDLLACRRASEVRQKLRAAFAALLEQRGAYPGGGAAATGLTDAAAGGGSPACQPV